MLERLTRPVQQLTYRESHAAAIIYSALFRVVHDDKRLDFGTKAIDCFKQYIKLAPIWTLALSQLKSGHIPLEGNEKARRALLDERGLTLFEYHNGFYCGHLWFDGGHRYTSFVVTPDGKLKYASLDLACRIVSDAQGQPETLEEAVDFLREVLRVLPYESLTLGSVQDIPPPVFDKLGKDELAHRKAEWQAFVEGMGRSITPPRREDIGGNANYTIYVYQRLGGQVIRCQIRFSSTSQVQIQQEIITRWIGDCWGIM
jgi:hypothetical protein